MKIEDIIPAQDKLKHFYLWTLLYLALAAILVPFMDDLIAITAALLVSVITSAKKELDDLIKKNGTPEVLDFLFSILAPFGFTILYIFSIFV